jgi:hypothetical protein
LFGLTGVREYPKGNYGNGDIDSGPVIFGFGGAATIVGMQTLSIFEEKTSSMSIRNAVESFAFPIEYNERKTYLFGQLPIADAFIAWSHSNLNVKNESAPSFIKFHLYSGIVFILLSIFLWIIVRPEKHDSKKSLHIPW